MKDKKVYKSIQEALLDYAKKGVENYDESMSAPVVYDPDNEELKQFIKECRQTGRTRTTTKKLLEKAYYEQMTKEIDISKVLIGRDEQGK